MSSKLVRLMSEVIVREGPSGRTRLALAIKRGERMIDRYLKGTSIPSSDKAYTIALACGCGQEEALKIAKECSSLEARARTA